MKNRIFVPYLLFWVFTLWGAPASPHEIQADVELNDPPGVETGNPTAFSHDPWDQVLRKYVTDDGLVQYEALREHPGDLVHYVQLVAKWSPDNEPTLFPTEAHRLAYWINAYNALIVNRVVQNYPIKGIKDLGGFMSSVFNKKQLVGGKWLSYNDIEHKIIRKRFKDPRIHFVLNCASRSCAPLGSYALTAENLEQSLQEAATNFLNDPRNVRIRRQDGKVNLSKYFDWFEDDFLNWLRKDKGVRRPNVLDYVQLYLAPDKQDVLAGREKWHIDFIDYDWSLNDAGFNLTERTPAQLR